ncbi:DinB family protein [Pontibacter qinzhouensis]|uniref:DinB family protein n=1 Tax=Pontibacter qinzhouensis TaxID=2603253 RepID=A0A5C8KCM8_9BACT|nr:DinB family protein [Pontibacter qinzhouensis]TXK50735.1 DinB family protein [Pontibacter qinzhouensis]
MAPQITFPAPAEYPDAVKAYVEAAKAEDILAGLAASQQFIINSMLELKEAQLNLRYQPGKWSIKEVLVHVADTERIFAYRALRFARHDKTPLPGFDQDIYVEPSKAAARTITSILNEYAAVRQSTIELFKSFDEEALNQTGLASNNEISVRAIGYAILGHEIHHLRIIREKYLQLPLI